MNAFENRYIQVLLGRKSISFTRSEKVHETTQKLCIMEDITLSTGVTQPTADQNPNTAAKPKIMVSPQRKLPTAGVSRG